VSSLSASRSVRPRTLLQGHAGRNVKWDIPTRQACCLLSVNAHC
jgi:hypothetical protein